jgi:hypothetical protein
VNDSTHGDEASKGLSGDCQEERAAEQDPHPHPCLGFVLEDLLDARVSDKNSPEYTSTPILFQIGPPTLSSPSWPWRNAPAVWLLVI